MDPLERLKSINSVKTEKIIVSIIRSLQNPQEVVVKIPQALPMENPGHFINKYDFKPNDFP